MSQDRASLDPITVTSLKRSLIAIGAVITWGSILGLGGVAQTLPQEDSQGNSRATDTAARFVCQWNQGQYTVMYNPESRPEESFPWAVPQDMGGGWFAEKRCNTISERLEEYRPDGLIEMKTSTENGYNIVCVTTEQNPACRIVFTVPPGQDPIATRDRVFENLASADSGQQTQAVNTFVGTNAASVDELINAGLSILTGSQQSPSSNAIPLRPYLDPADGGTGAKLSGGVPRQSAPRLNHKRFR